MRRSITAFILGIIGSLFSLFWGFVAGVVGNIGSIINIASNGGLEKMNFIYALGWIAFVGAIFGIIGSALCFKKARKGGILLAIATLACGALQGYLFSLYAKGGVMITTGVFVFLLPIVLLAVAAVSALCAKLIDGEAVLTEQKNKPKQKTNAKEDSLEEKLFDLKNMFEKGLITSDEYETARKNALDKFMK